MRAPAATYRLQLEPGFDLHAARALLPYLARLGVTHAYLSPIFEARPGSTHGYDVTDPSRVREELGGEAAFTALADAAAEAKLGLLLDIVPNHMAADAANPAWWDVLRLGAASPYAPWFDLSWHSGPAPFPVPLPVLGRPLEEVLEAGDLTLAQEESDVRLAYFDRSFPVSPEGLAWLAEAGPDPSVTELLRYQHYELRYWRDCAGVVGYRRFFDVDDLVSVRVEDPAVFDAVHAGLVRCLAHPAVAGVRVDHVDGLLDPTAYLQRLRGLLDTARPGLWLVVEKILAPDEALPPAWPVDGTTGYEFLTTVNGLHMPQGGARALRDLHRRLTGMTQDHDALARARKRQVLEGIFAGEWALLARELTALRHDGGGTDPYLQAALGQVSVHMDVYRTYVDAFEVSAADRRRIEAALDGAAGELPGNGPDAAALAFLRRVLLLDPALGPTLPAALAFVRRWQQFTGPLMAKGFEDTTLYRHSALPAANDVGGEPARPWTPPGEAHQFLAARAATPRTLNATSTHDTKRGEDVRARLDVLAEVPERWADAVTLWVEEEAAAHPPDPRTERLDDTVYLLYQTLVATWPADATRDGAWVARVQDYAVKAGREAKARTSWRDPDQAYEGALRAMVHRLLTDPAHVAFRTEAAALADATAAAGALVSLAVLLVKLTAPGVPDLYRGTELWRYELVDPDNRRPVDFPLRARLLERVAPLVEAPEAAGVARLVENWRDGALKLWLTAAGLACRRRHARAYAAGGYTPVRAHGPRADHLLAFQRGGTEGPMTLAPRLLAPDVVGSPTVGGEVWAGTSLDMPSGVGGEWRNALTGERATVRDARLPLEPLLATLPLALLEPG